MELIRTTFASLGALPRKVNYLGAWRLRKLQRKLIHYQACFLEITSFTTFVCVRSLLSWCFFNCTWLCFVGKCVCCTFVVFGFFEWGDQRLVIFLFFIKVFYSFLTCSPKLLAFYKLLHAHGAPSGDLCVLDRTTSRKQNIASKCFVSRAFHPTPARPWSWYA